MDVRLHTAVGREAAVNGQYDAGNEAGCLVVKQEQQTARQLFRFAEASHKMRLQQRNKQVKPLPVPVIGIGRGFDIATFCGSLRRLY